MVLRLFSQNRYAPIPVKIKNSGIFSLYDIEKDSMTLLIQDWFRIPKSLMRMILGDR
jgi:hypothetical protein